MIESVDSVFRDFDTPGVPSSGEYRPQKSRIRSWGREIEAGIEALGTNGGLIFDTRANLYASLDHAANTSAWVISDTTVAYNGIYRKAGASGAGSWSRVADLPYSFILATDVGAGTANAIVATTAIPLPSTAYKTVILMGVFEANTSAVTVAINGAAAKPLVTNSGGALANGYLAATMLAAFVDDGTDYRLVSDVTSAAIQAAAEAAQAAAAASAAAAALSAGANTLMPVQIAAAADEAFADTADLAVRKADGSLIKQSWANIKAALNTYFLGLASVAAVAGDIIVGTGAATLGRLAKGTVGQMLEMNSGATAAQWGLAPGSKLLNSGTVAAAATLDIVLPAGYRSYELVLVNFRPATDATDLRLRTSTDGGSSFDSGANYDWAYVNTSAIAGAGAGATGIDIAVDVGNATTEGASARIVISDPASTAHHTRFKYSSDFLRADNTPRGIFGAGKRSSAADVDAIRIMFAAGNITSGKWALLGIA